MNFLFLGFGPITSRFLESYVAPTRDNKVLVVSRNSSGTFPDGSILVSKPVLECFKDVNVVINSWRSLDYLDRGWEINYLKSLANLDNSKVLFLNLSSVAVYGECKDPADEDAVLNPINEYGIKKLEFEKYLKGIRMPNLLNLRISNVFGHSRFDDLINRIYNSITKGFSMKVFEPTKIFRDFIHIDQVAKYMHELLLEPDFSSGQRNIDVNISTGLSLALSEVIQVTENFLQRSLDFEISSVEPGMILESRISNKKLLDLIRHQDLSVKEQIKAYLVQLDQERITHM